MCGDLFGERNASIHSIEWETFSWQDLPSRGVPSALSIELNIIDTEILWNIFDIRNYFWKRSEYNETNFIGNFWKHEIKHFSAKFEIQKSDLISLEWPRHVWTCRPLARRIPPSCASRSARSDAYLVSADSCGAWSVAAETGTLENSVMAKWQNASINKFYHLYTIEFILSFHATPFLQTKISKISMNGFIMIDKIFSLPSCRLAAVSWWSWPSHFCRWQQRCRW